MTAAKRQIYTAEFEHEAVHLMTVPGYGVAEAARHLGIDATRLDRWKREHEAREHRAFSGKSGLSPARVEVHRRRQGNKHLWIWREILTKAAAFFAGESS